MITIESPAQRAYSLLDQGRATDALALTTPFAARTNADSAVLDAHAAALKALNRQTEAVEFNARATRAKPTSSVAWHNYAATLGDLERWPEALAAVNRAFAGGLNAPETWLVKARALQNCGDLAGAESAFQQAIRRRPACGWPDLAAYLADLKTALERLHVFKAHPLDQSLRGGSQTTQPLLYSEEPAIKAFFRAIDAPIRAYMSAVGTGNDPLRARNTGAYRIKGAWSVRLRAADYHVDHIHPQGWLSSAFYVETPAAVDRGHEGWLGFGRPIFRTRPVLEPERWVRPEPGRLVLFPSYLWHGTAPFASDESRLSLAFDVVPA